MNSLLISFLLSFSSLGLAAETAEDFLVEIEATSSLDTTLHYKIEQTNQKCIIESEEANKKLTQKECGNILKIGEGIEPEKYLSDQPTPHSNYFTITYKSDNQKWQKRIYQFEPGASQNEPIRKLALEIIKIVKPPESPTAASTMQPTPKTSATHKKSKPSSASAEPTK
jgi:hypothetical protein